MCPTQVASSAVDATTFDHRIRSDFLRPGQRARRGPWGLDACPPSHVWADTVFEMDPVAFEPFRAMRAQCGATCPTLNDFASEALRVSEATYYFPQGARFAVSRAAILKRPRREYQALLDAVKTDENPWQGFFAEYLWPHAVGAAVDCATPEPSASTRHLKAGASGISGTSSDSDDAEAGGAEPSRAPTSEGCSGTEAPVKVKLVDAYGDGWNGNVVTLRQVATGEARTLALETGRSDATTACMRVGQCYEVSVSGTGAYVEEISVYVGAALYDAFEDSKNGVRHATLETSGDVSAASCDAPSRRPTAEPTRVAYPPTPSPSAPPRTAVTGAIALEGISLADAEANRDVVTAAIYALVGLAPSDAGPQEDASFHGSST